MLTVGLVSRLSFFGLKIHYLFRSRASLYTNKENLPAMEISLRKIFPFHFLLLTANLKSQKERVFCDKSRYLKNLQFRSKLQILSKNFFFAINISN